ncbi:MAG: acyl carrier protein [Akkermansiaceae bacterium]|nr:acyl carrier protein [Verrucomicrobiales bacterium]
MNPTEITSSVCEAIGVVLRKSAPVPPDFNRTANTEWDSLKHVEVMFALEERFNVQFEQEDLEKLDSVEKISARLSELHEA